MECNSFFGVRHLHCHIGFCIALFKRYQSGRANQLVQLLPEVRIDRNPDIPIDLCRCPRFLIPFDYHLIINIIYIDHRTKIQLLRTLSHGQLRRLRVCQGLGISDIRILRIDLVYLLEHQLSLLVRLIQAAKRLIPYRIRQLQLFLPADLDHRKLLVLTHIVVKNCQQILVCPFHARCNCCDLVDHQGFAVYLTGVGLRPQLTHCRFLFAIRELLF